MKTLRIMTVVGARPQFVKAACISRAVAAFSRQRGPAGIDEFLVHTGQHYDDNMSKVFFDELQIPPPAINLEVGSGPHGCQTGAMLAKLEEIMLAETPDWVLVYGDTNSTLAGALAAAKLHIPIAHVEAGLRSFNRRMPEEINRVLTDHLAALAFCPTTTAVANLANEGIVSGVHHVGDVMFDSVLHRRASAGDPNGLLDRLGLAPRSFYLATVHRAENTDDPVRLRSILDAFGQADFPVVLPLHPRTRGILQAHAWRLGEGVRIIDPVCYTDMLALEDSARAVLTDSGGVQKEAYWSGVPCITLRDETEWTELVDVGANRLVGASEQGILTALSQLEANDARLPDDLPPHLYGDGKAANAIVDILADQVVSEHRRDPTENVG